MHIVVFTEDFYPNVSGGAHERWRFCQLASKRGHQVSVFTPRREGTPVRETRDDVNIYRPCRAQPAAFPAYSRISFVLRLIASFGIFLYAVKWFSGNDVDAIHSASNTTHWAAKLVGLLYSIPVISYVSFTPSYTKDSQRRLDPKLLLERLTFTYCMGSPVFCRGPDVKEILERAGNDDVRVVHGVLNTDRINEVAQNLDRSAVRERLGLSPDEHLLAFVGRLSPLKRPERAVHVLGQLSKEYNLVVVGDGPERSTVEEASSRLGVEERVSIIGEQPHANALEIIAAADALVLTSQTESYGMVVFEALAFGSHVFATPVGILPTIDHPKLHTIPLPEFAQRISAQQFDMPRDLDQSVIQQYSLERFANEIIGTIEDQVDSGT